MAPFPIVLEPVLIVYIVAILSVDKNEVEIELARQSGRKKFTLDEMMLNLAHELVHAKQFLKGELHPTLSKWKKFKKDYANTPYLKQP